MIRFVPEKNFYISTLINEKKFFSGFGTKMLGDGRRLDVIYTFLRNEKINFKKIIIAEQIHSANIAFISEKLADGIMEKIENVDGLVTNKEGIVLIVRTADCLPIIYTDEIANIIAVSHNGWRGTIKKITKNIIEKMISLGSLIKNIKVALGPSIGACCYKIDEDRYWNFKAEFDGYSNKIFIYRKGWYLNLPLLNYLFLQELGIRKENIDFFPFCTFCDKKRFYSFRRDKKQNYGEMFSFILRY